MSISPGPDDVAADPAAAVEAAAGRSRALAAELGAGGTIGVQLDLPPVVSDWSKRTGGSDAREAPEG